MKRTAFTMLELVFVIVVIGILAAIAAPRLAASRDDAQVAKGRSDVAAIRSAIISERQIRLLRGGSNYISRLDQGVDTGENVVIFDNNGTPTSTILMYGITTKNANGHWMKTGNTTYTYQILNDPVEFTYVDANGTFNCDHTEANCKLLTE